MTSAKSLLIASLTQFVAVLFSLGGWIDPVLGGTSIVAAFLVSLGAMFIGRVRIPKLNWISVVAAVLLAVGAVASLLAAYDPNAGDEQLTTIASSPAVVAFNLAFRVASVSVIAGEVFYLVLIATAYRAAKLAGDK
jgi:hypothetical protein